jgi:hypothetical protein
MAQIKSIRKVLLNSLDAGLKAKGFRKSKDIFYRRITIGKEILFAALLKDQLEVTAIVDVSLRHHALELEYTTIEGTTSNPNSSTIGAELGELSGGKTIMWDVSDLRNIQTTVNDILDCCWQIGFPYLEKYSSPEKLLDALSDDNVIGPMLCAIPHVRAKKALVAAYLLQRQDIYGQILDKKVAYLQGIESPFISEYLRFAYKLREQFTGFQQRS